MWSDVNRTQKLDTTIDVQGRLTARIKHSIRIILYMFLKSFPIILLHVHPSVRVLQTEIYSISLTKIDIENSGHTVLQSHKKYRISILSMKLSGIDTVTVKRPLRLV